VEGEELQQTMSKDGGEEFFCKLFGQLDDTTTTSITFQPTYLSFLIPISNYSKHLLCFHKLWHIAKFFFGFEQIQAKEVASLVDARIFQS